MGREPNHPVGISTVYEPPEGIETVADVCFVHGLGGHREETWTSTGSEKNSGTVQKFFQWLMTFIYTPANETEASDQHDVLWPKDLLHQDLENVRIMMWGYDSAFTRLLSGSNQSSLLGYGKSLLNDLAIKRRDQKQRPLILVGHSLGGLVIQSALFESSGSVLQWGTIYPSTRGVIFMGTPLRGSPEASHGQHLAFMAQACQQSPNSQLVDSLRNDSHILEVLRENFEKIVGDDRLDLTCFYEQDKTNIPLVGPKHIVPAFCAGMDGKRVKKMPIPGDHRTMCKFDSRDSSGYNTVMGELRSIVDVIIEESKVTVSEEQERARARNEAERKELLESLRFENMDDAQDRIQPNFAGTFEWIFKQPNAQSWNSEKSFVCWLLAEEPVFWIMGKPASGKSTLMKSIHEHPKLETYLRSWIGPGELVTACCFIRRTAKSRLLCRGSGILRSLLCQMILQVPELVSVVRAARSANKSISDFSTSSNWSWNQLERAFKDCLAQKPSGVKFFLLVDGLDEFESLDEGDDPTKEKASRERTSELATTMKLFLGAESYHDVKICFASRPTETIKYHLDRFPSLRIHDHTRDDIRLYTNKQLGEFKHWEWFEPEKPDAMERLSEMIQDKAYGVFMWVRVVVMEILEQLQYGPNFLDLQQIVESSPEELSGEDGLYVNALKRHGISGERLDQGLRMLYHLYDFQSVQESSRIFKIVQVNPLMLAIAEELDGTSDGICQSMRKIAHLIGSKTKCEAKLSTQIIARINSHTAGLLEVQDRDPKKPCDLGATIFAHETVREFLEDRDSRTSMMSDTKPGRRIDRLESLQRILLAHFLVAVYRFFVAGSTFLDLTHFICLLGQPQLADCDIVTKEFLFQIIDTLFDMAKEVDNSGLWEGSVPFEEELLGRLVFSHGGDLRIYFLSRYKKPNPRWFNGLFSEVEQRKDLSTTTRGRPFIDVFLTYDDQRYASKQRLVPGDGFANISWTQFSVKDFLELPGSTGLNHALESLDGQTVWQRYLHRGVQNRYSNIWDLLANGADIQTTLRPPPKCTEDPIYFTTARKLNLLWSQGEAYSVGFYVAYLLLWNDNMPSIGYPAEEHGKWNTPYPPGHLSLFQNMIMRRHDECDDFLRVNHIEEPLPSQRRDMENNLLAWSLILCRFEFSGFQPGEIEKLEENVAAWYQEYYDKLRLGDGGEGRRRYHLQEDEKRIEKEYREWERRKRDLDEKKPKMAAQGFEVQGLRLRKPSAKQKHF
ncbi:hypothetical protein HDK90DRAFT_490627 [Phyllosticta capitalensis]|uniref:Nephrocystin 3-like N-terminal domain-containing protein n=1 Tax=Phyllosticta capitalensis TaxID=121624 RepID=A0ABR1YI30_9PEZI